MNELKRRPLLADSLLARKVIGPSVYKTHQAQRNEALRTAKRFVLDGTAAQYLGQMLEDHPRIVADAQDFAIPPFKQMWIEFPLQPFFRQITGFDTDPYGDRVLGYLYDGPVVSVAASMDKMECGWMPVDYILHRPSTLKEEIEVAVAAGTSRMQLDFWFWGQTASRFCDDPGIALTPESRVHIDKAAWDSEGLRALRANHSVRFSKAWDLMDRESKSIFIRGSGGDLRNIVALLLFLNRTRDIQTVKDIGYTPALLNRKPRALVTHSVISLKLDPAPLLRKLVAGEGIKRRLHDVRGHFCHDKRARAGCTHGEMHDGDFGEFWVEYEPLRWNCERCNGKRWWRREHSRGKFEDGMVIQEYAVKR